MKRILVGILALVMVLGLVGCGNSSKEIDEKLQGVWTVRGELYGRTYSFDNGNYESTLINPLGENNYSGTYKIVDEGIIMVRTNRNLLIFMIKNLVIYVCFLMKMN